MKRDPPGAFMSKPFGCVHSTSPRQRGSATPPENWPWECRRELWSFVQYPRRNLERRSLAISGQCARPGSQRLNRCRRGPCAIGGVAALAVSEAGRILATANSQGRNFVAGEEVKTPSCENLLGAIGPSRSEMNRA